MSQPMAVDLFCGAGGLTCGMRQAGIKVVAGIDADKKMKDIYEKNNPGSKFILDDIRNVTGEQINQLFAISGDSKILAGCAPCKPFSTMNRKGGSKHTDYTLLDSFSRLILEIKPDGVIMENVPGITKKGGKIFSNFLESLEKVGLQYAFTESLDAADYGVPQHRKRLILIAAREKPSFPKKSHGPRTERPYKTVNDVIGKIKPISAGYREYNLRNHSCKALSETNLLRLRKTPHDGGSRKDIPVELWIPSHRDHSGHSDTYGRMAWNKPSPTLTCSCLSVSNGRYAHPEQDRGISIREAAMLQTFPKRYSLPSTFEDAQRAIGNAFPPLLARKFSRALLRSLDP